MSRSICFAIWMRQTFRYNHREGLNDADRFDVAVRQIVGKRLTFDELTCKTQVDKLQPF